MDGWVGWHNFPFYLEVAFRSLTTSSHRCPSLESSVMASEEALLGVLPGLSLLLKFLLESRDLLSCSSSGSHGDAGVLAGTSR